MEHYNLIAPENLGKGSPIKLDVSTAEVDIYWKVAMEVLTVIAENNRKGEPTVMVVSYGPRSALAYPKARFGKMPKWLLPLKSSPPQEKSPAGSLWDRSSPTAMPSKAAISTICFHRIRR